MRKCENNRNLFSTRSIPAALSWRGVHFSVLQRLFYRSIYKKYINKKLGTMLKEPSGKSQVRWRPVTPGKANPINNR